MPKDMVFTFLKSIEGGFVAWYEEKSRMCLVEGDNFRELRTNALEAQKIFWEATNDLLSPSTLRFSLSEKPPILFQPTLWDNPTTFFDWFTGVESLDIRHVGAAKKFSLCKFSQAKVYLFPNTDLKPESLGIFESVIVGIMREAIEKGTFGSPEIERVFGPKPW